MKILLIRHGMTAGNQQKRYIGRTDEPLCQEGIAALCPDSLSQWSVQKLFASPLKRCLQTADILFAGMTAEIAGDLRECDFGAFENKNYMELSDNPQYQRWIDSGGTLRFPQGESREEYIERTVNAFREILKASREKNYDTIAIVAHGGTIMSVMQIYGIPAGDYYDFQVKNGCGYVLDTDKELCNYEFLECISHR